MSQKDYNCRFISRQFEFVVFGGSVAYLGNGRDLFWRWRLEGLKFFDEGIFECGGCHVSKWKRRLEEWRGRYLSNSRRRGGNGRYSVLLCNVVGSRGVERLILTRREPEDYLGYPRVGKGLEMSLYCWHGEEWPVTRP